MDSYLVARTARQNPDINGRALYLTDNGLWSLDIDQAKRFTSGSVANHSGVRVRTHNEFPPIPVRTFDWNAIDDDSYDGADDSNCPIGHGATEQDAIDDLLEQIAEARP